MHMGKILKNFGLGLVYILLLPFLLAVLVLVALYGVFVSIVMFFKGMGRFFRGLSFFAPFEEDVKVDEIKKAQIENQIHPNGVPAQQTAAPAPQNVYVQNNYYQTAPTQPTQPQQPNPTPIDANGYFKQNPQGPTLGMKDSTPVIDMSKTPEEIASTPKEAQPVYEEIPQKKSDEVIDISKDDDGKDDL